MNNAIKKILKHIDTLDGYWSLDWQSGQYLHDLVLEHKPSRILEFGTSVGFSGTWLAPAAATYGGELYTVESHPERFGLAHEHFSMTGLDNINMINGHAPSVFNNSLVENITDSKVKQWYQNKSKVKAPNPGSQTLQLDELKFDMVFLDCIKKYYLELFKLILPNLNPGAVVIADNVASHPEPTREYLELVQTKHKTEVIELDSNTLIVTTV